MYWSSDSKHLLIINEPLSGTDRLLFFTVSALAGGAQASTPDALDKAVYDALSRRLGEKKSVEFYLLRYVSWQGSRLVLAVGGATSTRNVRPMEGYCYGVLVDSDSLRVKGVMSEKELKATTGRSCVTSP